MHSPLHCLNPLQPSQKIVDYSPRNNDHSYVFHGANLMFLHTHTHMHTHTHTRTHTHTHTHMDCAVEFDGPIVLVINE